MADITKTKKEDIEKFLRGKVRESGFSFENKVANRLKSKFTIAREEPYFDKDGDKGRAFDILATQRFPDEYQLDKNMRNSIGRIDLIIECKDISGNIWVFSPSKSPDLSYPFHASMNYMIKDPAMNVIPNEPIKNIPYVSAYTEYVFDEGKSNKQCNNLFSVVNSIAKAAHHQRETMQNAFELMKNWEPKVQNFILHFVFFQPIIVFSGKLYIMEEGEELKFTSAKYVQMKNKYLSRDYKDSRGEIHIVSFDALPEYIEKITRYLRQNENIMVKHQEQMHNALKRVMPNLK